MPTLYLTPASISYLNQFLVAVMITVYLGVRFFVSSQQPPSRQDRLLITFFVMVTAFSFTLFLDVSLLPEQRLIIVFLQNPVVALLLIALIQFAYHFPTCRDAQKRECRMALFLSSAYALWEIIFCAWRFYQFSQGQVEFRQPYMDYLPVVEFLWVIIVFARGTILSWNTLASQRFAIIFFIPFFLAIANLLSALELISTPVYHISMSIGILISLYLFALNYLVSKPEATSIKAKFSGAAITSGLAVFGVVAWLVTPIYAAQYRPALTDQRTLHFAPNQQGGYDVSQVDFHFERLLGDPINLGDSASSQVSTQATGFDFPFYGKHYQELFVADDGVISFGKALDYKDLEDHFSNLPVIFGPMLDLDPGSNPNGGIYLHRKDGELVVTYSKLSSAKHPENKYTFQIRLFSNGSFELTSNGLPQGQQYFVNDSPRTAIWAIGAKPAEAPEQTVSFANLPLHSGPEGVIQDEYRSFRVYLHIFLLPLTGAVLAGGLFFMLGLPLVLNYMLTRPLSTLVRGVRLLNQGQLGLRIPVQFNDEIGFLTESFNKLAGELDGLIENLETRVTDRTFELIKANEQLSKLSIVIEQSPSSIIITDLNANIEYVNPAFTLTTGYSADEVIGKNPSILKSNQTPPGTFQEMWATLHSGNTWRGELSNRKKNGQVYWEYTVIAPIQAHKNHVTHYVAVKDDITERKQVEQSLKESEKQYRDLFEMESDAIFIIRNADGAILEANSAAAALYGYSHHELVSMHNADLSAEPEDAQETVPAPASQIITIPLRWHRKKDGTVFPIETTARFIEWKGQAVYIAAIRDVTERQHAEKELERLAITDSLTGIFNRGHFFVEAEKLFQRCQHPRCDLTILMLDIDHFKKVNDTYGHDVGDVVLQEVTRRLQENLRPTDLFGRYGGEEFVALIARTPYPEVSRIADRLVDAVNESRVEVKGLSISVTISMGVAESTENITDLNELLAHADHAMYTAKQAGRNRWAAWPESIPQAE